MIIDLLVHTLIWGLTFILTFNLGVILAAFVTVMAQRKREKRAKKDKS